MTDPLDLVSRLGWPPEELEVIDLGCGTRSSALSKTLRTLPFRHLVGIDMDEAYLDLLRRIPNAARHVHYFQMDVRTVDERFPPKHFDVALLLDVLEHLEKDHGAIMLENLKKLVRRRILIWLPLGNTIGYHSLQTGADAAAKELETHRSAWTAHDLRRLRYTVEVFPAYHRHLSPPADAAWATLDLT